MLCPSMTCHNDEHAPSLSEMTLKITNTGCRISWWYEYYIFSLIVHDTFLE